MRHATLLALACALCGCGDPGPRDRSLNIVDKSAVRRPSPRTKKGEGKKLPSTSVIGLVSDPLAPFYAEGAPLVVRFDDMTSLLREAGPKLKEIRRGLPVLGLPKGKPDALVRRALKLPKKVVFDPLRPFAFVKSKRGWVGIVPTRGIKYAPKRMRALDGIYCVAGDPEAVAKYEPGFRKGFYLPGDCSVLAKPAAIPSIGKQLTEGLRVLGLDLSFLDGAITSVPDDIDRIDMSLRFGQSGMRADVRLAPRPGTATSLHLERIRPEPSASIHWLPPDGTAYFELAAPYLEWEGLLLNLFRDTVSLPEPDRSPALYAARQGLSLLDRDASVMLDLDPDGSGHVYVVASLRDTSAAHGWFGSRDFDLLLRDIAGPGGHLEWKPEVFSRGGVIVSAIKGHISRKRIMAWRQQGLLRSTLSTKMRGPVVAYVAILDDKLCIVIGQHARSEMERFLDSLLAGKPDKNEHSAAVDTLFRVRLASFSADVAAVFDGCREAGPFWHPKGEALRSLALRWQIPAAAAVTVEGGALRVAVRVPPRMLADAAAKIIDALRKATEEGSD
jgi:hypothetical protein